MIPLLRPVLNTSTIATRITTNITIINTTTIGARMASQLPSLPEVERLSPACIRILGGNPGKFTLQGTNTYLVGTGARRLLVDTGEGKPSWIASLRRVLAEEGATVSQCLLTHWHPDHVGGVSQLLAEGDGQGRQQQQQSPPKTEVYKRQPEPGSGQRDIADGQVFAVEGATLRAVATPGHTADHVALVLEEEDALFTGDNVLGHGTAVFEDLPAYLASLARMQGLVRGRGYPGHGAVLPSAPDRVAEYIRHRRQREEQVLEVLGSSPPGGGGNGNGNRPADPSWWDAMDIVRVIYKDVPENLHVPALGGVLQILRKLEGEDKVVCENDLWRLKDRSSL